MSIWENLRLFFLNINDITGYLYYFPIGLTHFLCLGFLKEAIIHRFILLFPMLESLLPSLKSDIDVISGLLALLTTSP